jgi:hypothetical protein
VPENLDRLWAEPTLEKVSKKQARISRSCESGSNATLPASPHTRSVGRGQRYSPRRALFRSLPRSRAFSA